MTYRLSDPLIAACPHEDGCDGAAACRAAGHCVALPVQMLCNEPDFTVVPTELHKLDRKHAVEAQRSDMECFSLLVPSTLPMPLYDTSCLALDLPTDDDIQDDYRAAVAEAVRYLDMLDLLERPVPGCPHFVSFKGA